MKTLQTLKGFQDILPKEARARSYIKDIMVTVFEKWGYSPIETPTLEPLEIFEGQVGEDEKLFYKFKDYGGRDVALRYDQTVPTVRFLSSNFNELTFPFKRYQIAPVFRAEKPQKGRFREFTQADVDIFGVDSPTADAEAIAISIDVCKEIGFDNFKILINSRSLMKDFPYEAIVSIDKLEKIGEKGVTADMIKKGISEKDSKNFLNAIKNLMPNEEIKKIFEYLKSSGYDEKNYEFCPTLARSFSYSQGPIWEIVVEGYSGGSVGGGERYDGMVEKLTGKQIPATGVAFGLERVVDAANEANLLPDFNEDESVLVTVFNEDTYDKSLEIASELRSYDIAAYVYPDSTTKLEKQLKYANKTSIRWVIIIGPEEIASDKVKLKDMEDGKQEMLSLDNAVQLLFKAQN